MFKTTSSKYSAKESAIYLLSRRDHGAYELQQKLAGKGYIAEEIEAAIGFCLDNNYLNDLRYAKSQIRQHISKGNGKLRILQELKLKRVAETDINLAFDEEEVDWYQLAKSVALKKFKGVKAKEQKEYAKQVRFLQYRGFDFDQISYALSAQE